MRAARKVIRGETRRYRGGYPERTVVEHEYVDVHGRRFFIEPDRLRRLKHQMYRRDRMRPAEGAVCDRLINEVGGLWVCMPVIEEDARRIVARGRAWPGNARFLRGRPIRCHQNAAWLYAHHKRWKIATGYALSEDGIWRQHSWAIDSRNQLVETTVARVLYYGFVLTKYEAEVFVSDNWL